MENILNIPEYKDIRYKIKLYKRYYPIICAKRLMNIFNCDYKYALKRVSIMIPKFSLKDFIKRYLHLISDEKYSEELYNYIFENYFYKGIRELKTFSKRKMNINKRNKTMLEKYGFISNFCRDDVQDKVKQTNLEKYGFECAVKNKEISKKVSQTFNNKSLDEKDIIKEKISKANKQKSKEALIKRKQTNLEKYNVENVMQNEEILQKNKKSIENVDFDKRNEKSRITCLEKYNVDNYSKTLEYKEKVKNTLIKNKKI